MPRHDQPRACARCQAPLPAVKRGNARYCLRCGIARRREQQEARRQRSRQSARAAAAAPRCEGCGQKIVGFKRPATKFCVRCGLKAGKAPGRLPSDTGGAA